MPTATAGSANVDSECFQLGDFSPVGTYGCRIGSLPIGRRKD